MRNRIRNILLESTARTIEIDGKMYNVKEIYENSEGGGQETSMKDVRKYLEKLKQLWENGGEVYRIIFANSLDDIDMENSGSSWFALPRGIDENASYLFGQPAVDKDIENAYVLVGNVPSKDIHIECSISQFLEFPMEIEVCTNNVEVVKVYEYDWENRWNSNLIWKR